MNEENKKNNAESSSLLGSLTRFVLMFAIGTLNTLFLGYIFSLAWKWFVVSVFNVPQFGTLEFTGLIVTFNVLVNDMATNIYMVLKNQTLALLLASVWDDIVKGLSVLFMGRPLMLLFVYVWHLILH